MSNGSKILVTGATGFVGRALIPALVSKEFEVLCAVRPEVLPEPPAPLLGASLFPVAGLGPCSDWSEALGGCDAVIHLAGMAHVRTRGPFHREGEFMAANYGATLALGLQAARASVRRFVYVSTIGVNGSSTPGACLFSEADPPAPENAYAASKLAAEKALRNIEQATGMEVVIVRPPLVYGPRARANMLRLIRLVASGLPLPFLCVNNRRDFIGLANLVDALVICLTHRAAQGRTFLVSDGKTMSTRELVRRIARAMGRRPRLFPFPAGLMGILLGFTGRERLYQSLWADLRIDATAIQTILGWTPKFPPDRDIDAAVRWYFKPYEDDPR